MQDKFEVMAAEADAFSDAINSLREPSDDLLREGLKNDYDVIVSDAIDYLLSKGRVEDFIQDIYLATKKLDSYLIRGRVRVIIALTGNTQLQELLYDRHFIHDDYYRVWESAAKYLETKDKLYLLALDNYALDNDMTISSLSRSLKNFVDK